MTAGSEREQHNDSSLGQLTPDIVPPPKDMSRYAYDFDAIPNAGVRVFMRTIYASLLPDEQFPKTRAEVADTYARIGLEAELAKEVFSYLVKEKQLKFLVEEQGHIGRNVYYVDQNTFGTFSAFYLLFPGPDTKRRQDRFEGYSEGARASIEGSIFEDRIGVPEVMPEGKAAEKSLSPDQKIPEISEKILNLDLQRWDGTRARNFQGMLYTDLRDIQSLLRHGISQETILAIRFCLAKSRGELDSYMPEMDGNSLKQLLQNLPQFRQELLLYADLQDAVTSAYPEVTNLAYLFIGLALQAQKEGYRKVNCSEDFARYDRSLLVASTEEQDPTSEEEIYDESDFSHQDL